MPPPRGGWPSRTPTRRVGAERRTGSPDEPKLAPRGVARRVRIQACRGSSTSAPAGTVATGKKGAPSDSAPKDLRKIEKVGTGRGPWLVERIKMSVTLANAALSKATALDPNGYATGAVNVQRNGGQLTLTLPEDALHVILE